MKLITMHLDDAHYDIIVVLEPLNVARMAQFDPAVIYMERMPADLRAKKLRHIILATPTAEDIASIEKISASGGNLREIAKIVGRGLKFTADDDDMPYISERSTKQ